MWTGIRDAGQLAVVPTIWDPEKRRARDARVFLSTARDQPVTTTPLPLATVPGYRACSARLSI